MRVLICDDEPLALDRLSDLLGQCPAVELVAACGSGSEAIERIGVLRPQLVMLDIEMPRIDGFDVVEALLGLDWPDPQGVPLICFVTAFPQFAADAFESGALDFLAKPVRLQRLEKALERARAALDQREAVRRLRELSGQLDLLRRGSQADDSRWLWIHRAGEAVRVDALGLERLQAEGEYVRLHTAERSFLYRGSITALAEQLAPHGFVRIHRSTVVNTERLTAIRSAPGGGLRLGLSSGAEVAVGRKFRQQVHALAGRRG